MNKKRILLTVLAMVLVCVLSVAGTLALLAESTTTPVTNTFVASTPDPDDFVGTFAIMEYQVAADDAGNYDYVTTGEGENKAKVEVDENTYNVVPGVTLPKDAFVKLDRESNTPAYLFIEVVNKLSDEFTMNVDTDVWTKLVVNEQAVIGKNGGEVYVLSADAEKTDATILGAVEETTLYHIIDDNKVTVDSEAELAITAGTNDTIKFYAYICQATVAKTDGTNTSVPAEVFDICF